MKLDIYAKWTICSPMLLFTGKLRKSRGKWKLPGSRRRQRLCSYSQLEENVSFTCWWKSPAILLWQVSWGYTSQALPALPNFDGNVPTDRVIPGVARVIASLVDSEPTLPKNHYIRLKKLCVDFGYFELTGEESRQVSGQRSPLSAFLACLFMGTLERHHYKYN